jgi:hypothetical protein
VSERNALKATLKEARRRGEGDKDAAIALYKGVAEQKCCSRTRPRTRRTS